MAAITRGNMNNIRRSNMNSPFSFQNIPYFVLLLSVAVSLSTLPSGVSANEIPVITLSMAPMQDNAISMTEDSAISGLFALLQVSDPDIGPDGEVTCHIDNQFVGLEFVVRNMYQVKPIKQLDREVAPLVEVVIICTDQGNPPLSSTASFNIVVKDSNDNAPQFTQNVYEFSLPENSQGVTLVGFLLANDKDEGQNAAIVYSLETKEGDIPSEFTIDGKSGEITSTSPQDREMSPEIKLIAFATDMGIESLVGRSEVIIKITDVNDNIPQITTTVLSIDENLPALSHVGSIMAKDNDTGVNAVLQFALVRGDSGTPPFIVNSMGKVSAFVALDRESRSEYELEISVTDQGTPSYTSTAIVVVKVNDVNDNSPIILFPTATDLNEYNNNDNNEGSYNIVNGSFVVDWYNPGKDKTVVKLTAMDNDLGENGQVYFSIDTINSKPADGSSLFGVDRNSGEVFLQRRVQSDDSQLQTLVLLVHDGGIPALSTSTSINVTLDVDFDFIATLPAPTNTTFRNTDNPNSLATTVRTSSVFYMLFLVYSFNHIFNVFNH